MQPGRLLTSLRPVSRLPYELFLALRYLRPKRTFVSVITVISMLGVILGVAVLIIVISVMTGFDRQLREKILGFNAHLKIYPVDDTLAGHREVMRAVNSNRLVRASAPFIFGPVLLRTQPVQGRPIVAAPHVRGLDLLLESNVTSVASSMVAGELNLDGESIVLGADLARRLQVRVGDRVSLYSARHLKEFEDQKGQPADTAIPPDDFTVRGIFEMGYYEYDANIVLTSLRNAQSLYELKRNVHGLLVMLHDPYQADAAAAQLQRVLGPRYQLQTWTEDNAQILTALVVEKKVMFYLLVFIVIVAAFGIMNSQITFVVQKTREIGMLKALGATRAQLIGLFLGQSLVVGVLGVLGGLGLGLLMVEVRNPFLNFMNRVTGLELFPREIYSFSELPALVIPWDVAMICGTALVICVLAGLGPAWNASRLKPVEALRHE